MNFPPRPHHRTRVSTRLALVLLLLAATLAGPPAPPLRAATLTVANADNGGAGSLRQAMADAVAGETITFDPSLSGQTIVLEAQLVLDRNLTIDGSGLEPPITISGEDSVRVFQVNEGVTATLSGLIVANGDSPTGGGIYSLGSLTITDCTFSGNAAQMGGGIYSEGPLTVTGSTFAGNTAGQLTGGGGAAIFGGSEGMLTMVANSDFHANDGGAIENRGTLTVANSTFSGNSGYGGSGIWNAGTLTVTDSSFSDNTCLDAGGCGIYNHNGGVLTATRCTFSRNSSTNGPGGGIRNTATLTATQCTFYANTADFSGGGIHTFGTATVTNSTFSGNAAPNGAGINSTNWLSLANSVLANSVGTDCAYWGALASNHHNLIEDGSCDADLNGDLTGDPLLGALADNGGPTRTVALLGSSPAINGGDPGDCPATDQRGVGRPQGSGCDIGAYELRMPSATTGDATGMSATGATLHGTATSPDGDAAATFEYGLDTGYGETLAADPATVSAGTDTPVSAPLSDLAPNTTYHYRVVATNGAGAAHGEDATFVTAKAPPEAVTEPASDVTRTAAVLHATVNAHNDSTAVTFEYGLDTGYGETLAADPATVSAGTDTPVSAPLGDLAPNTTYHYRVVAINGAGSARGVDRTFTTPPTFGVYVPLVGH